MGDEKQQNIFTNNLNYFIENKQLSQREIADSLGVSPQTFNTWCKGIAIPRMGKIQALADYFGINKSDLIEDHIDRPADASQAYTPEETNLITKYRTLNRAGQEKVNDYIDDLASSDKYRSDPSDRRASDVLKNIHDSKMKSAL